MFSFTIDDTTYKRTILNLKNKQKKLKSIQKKAINQSLDFLKKQYKEALKSELGIKDKKILSNSCRLGKYKDKTKIAQRTIFNIGDSKKYKGGKKYFLIANTLSEGSKSRQTALKKNRGHIKSRGSIFTSAIENNKSRAMQILQEELQKGLSEN